jgi:hypothetical protein
MATLHRSIHGIKDTLIRFLIEMKSVIFGKGFHRIIGRKPVLDDKLPIINILIENRLYGLGQIFARIKRYGNDGKERQNSGGGVAVGRCSQDCSDWVYPRIVATGFIPGL